MFEDEMTEEHICRTAEEYYRLNTAEIQEERLAVARAYITALEGQIAILKWRDRMATLAMLPVRR